MQRFERGDQAVDRGVLVGFLIRRVAVTLVERRRFEDLHRLPAFGQRPPDSFRLRGRHDAAHGPDPYFHTRPSFGASVGIDLTCCIDSM